LVGLHHGSGYGSSGGALPNVLQENSFFSENRRSRNRFEEAKVASAPPEESLCCQTPLQSPLSKITVVLVFQKVKHFNFDKYIKTLIFMRLVPVVGKYYQYF
jgi:hypothetical protein